jgi:exosortase J
MAEGAEILACSTAELAPARNPARPSSRAILLGSGIAFLALAGCLGIYREIEVLWKFWTTDPLRSIGILIPPVSVLLTLRVWRQAKWELRGTWWGLPLIAIAFLLDLLRQRVMLFGAAGNALVSIVPVSLPVYLYGSGIVLLFAGARVWRRAWFPLGLLLLCQPVPILTDGLIDLPLQNLSARVARWFATVIGFAPTTPQLRLMFSPDFGMFIAPGCDGIRGAVTMGYVALVLGYVKRVTAPLWAAYVAGAVLLGYLFNFIRLCALVVYYRVALGSPKLEGFAKWADYAIGSCLFFGATLLFVWLARRKPMRLAPAETVVGSAPQKLGMRTIGLHCAAFGVIVLAALALPSSALRQAKAGAPAAAMAGGQLPHQVGDFKLTRTWFEQQDGVTVNENGAYAAPGSDEVILGVWIAPLSNFHDANACWLTRGLQPDSLTSREFRASGGETVPLNVGYYSDGISDSILINAICSPGSCSEYQRSESVRRVGVFILEPQLREFAGTGAHPVSMMIRINKPQGTAPKQLNYDQLSSEAEKFVSGLDFRNLSRQFQ